MLESKVISLEVHCYSLVCFGEWAWSAFIARIKFSWYLQRQILWGNFLLSCTWWGLFLNDWDNRLAKWIDIWMYKWMAGWKDRSIVRQFRSYMNVTDVTGSRDGRYMWRMLQFCCLFQIQIMYCKEWLTYLLTVP